MEIKRTLKTSKDKATKPRDIQRRQFKREKNWRTRIKVSKKHAKNNNNPSVQLSWHPVLVFGSHYKAINSINISATKRHEKILKKQIYSAIYLNLNLCTHFIWELEKWFVTFQVFSFYYYLFCCNSFYFPCLYLSVRSHFVVALGWHSVLVTLFLRVDAFRTPPLPFL